MSNAIPTIKHYELRCELAKNHSRSVSFPASNDFMARIKAADIVQKDRNRPSFAFGQEQVLCLDGRCIEVYPKASWVTTRTFETVNNSVTLTGTWDKHLNLMHVHAYVENDGGNWSATKYFANLDEAEQHFRSRLV